jgi:hypothetical protein
MQYLEIDLSLTNTSNKQDPVTCGDFFYQTMAGKELVTATTIGTDSPGKNVEVVGKEALVAEFLKAGQTVDTKYVIYQIPKGDKGKLVWKENPDSSSNKLGIFNLY